MTTYYLHTIRGRPAHYVPGQQICYITRFGAAGTLVTSLRQIRREQKASIKHRQDIGLDQDGSNYGYRRVRVPS